MYTAHFGLTEPPFAITPDPRYLYLSPRHREAMAHLLYGISEPGGFVVLTGEVGTGKTTLCRSLLEQVPPNVDVALILNPRLSSAELLAAACDEFHIAYPRGTTSLKLLMDALHRYLLDTNGHGRRTVLIVDEAQHLAPEVLEQIRLLTNLETTKEKLLQVILIGQPELSEVLERPDLRQVAQRVTARYHLMPFSDRETRGYVRHRLKIAGARDMVFTPGALRRVHQLSRGVPRLINIVCDRALLGAYASDRDQVDSVTVVRAAREVRGRRARRRPVRRWLWVSAAAAGGMAVMAATWILLVPAGSTSLVLPPVAPPAPAPAASVPGSAAAPPPPAAAPPAPAAPAPSPVAPAGGAAAIVASPSPATSPSGGTPAAPAQPEATPRPTPALGALDPVPIRLAALLQDRAQPMDRRSALARLYARWGLDLAGVGPGFDCEREAVGGMHCLIGSGTWTRLRRLDAPATIELLVPPATRRYATVVGLGAEAATLDVGGRLYLVPLADLALAWDGGFTVLWQPPPVTASVLWPGMRGLDVAWVRERLPQVDGRPPLPPGDVYDAALAARVREFQRGRGLIPDGLVGAETLAHLAMDPGQSRRPRLTVSR
jgi:general secretion pathway protein A